MSDALAFHQPRGRRSRKVSPPIDLPQPATVERATDPDHSREVRVRVILAPADLAALRAKLGSIADYADGATVEIVVRDGDDEAGVPRWVRVDGELALRVTQVTEAQ